MKKYQLTVPFGGFYCSIFSGYFEDIERDREEAADELAEELPNYNWSEIAEKIATKYVRYLASELGVEMVFADLIRPREYNFTTDRLIAETTYEELVRIYDRVKGAPLDNAVKDKFTSRDGFVSFYYPDVTRWGPLEKWDVNQLGTLLDALVEMTYDRDCGESPEWNFYESYGCWEFV